MKTPLFTGCGTAIITPFRNDQLDLPAFRRMVELQAAGGTSAIIVCGTTGEAATLSEKEHEALYRCAARSSGGRMKIVAGIGSNNTRHALDMALLAQDCGADGVLMVTPYYNKTTQAGLVAHFSYVADRVGLPVIAYNVPSRTGIGIEPETYLELSRHPNINGVKEASGNIEQFARSIALCGDELNFWSGNDGDTVAMMKLGAKGVVSVASNLLPGVVARMCHLCLGGHFTAAEAQSRRYGELFRVLFREVNPIPVKAAAELMGLCGGELRLPLVPMESAHRAELMECLIRCGCMDRQTLCA